MMSSTTFLTLAILLSIKCANVCAKNAPVAADDVKDFAISYSDNVIDIDSSVKFEDKKVGDSSRLRVSVSDTVDIKHCQQVISNIQVKYVLYKSLKAFYKY